MWSHQQGAVKISLSLAGYDKSGVHCGVRRPTAWHPGVCYSKYSSVTPLSGPSSHPQEWTEAGPPSEESFTPTLQQHWNSKVSPEEFLKCSSLSFLPSLFSTFSGGQPVLMDRSCQSATFRLCSQWLEMVPPQSPVHEVSLSSSPLLP